MEEIIGILQNNVSAGVLTRVCLGPYLSFLSSEAVSHANSAVFRQAVRTRPHEITLSAAGARSANIVCGLQPRLC